MGGVDVMSQKAAAYRIYGKSKDQFYLRMFFDLIDVSLVKSHIVYTELGNDISLLNFKIVVTKALIGEMLIDSSREVTTIKVVLKLSTSNPLHFSTLIQIFNYFKTSEGESIIKSDFQATRITNVAVNPRQGNIPSLDSYL